MISLSDPGVPLRRAALDSRGGFAWWYVDLIDGHGRGLVLIWSFGLPFLPGYRSGVRSGSPTLARDRPSLNIATYADGRSDMYLLQEWPAEDVRWDSGTERVTFGDVAELVTTASDGSRTLCATLDLALPGTRERLAGSVEVTGPMCRLPPSDLPANDHSWSPLTTATTGSASLRMGDAWRFDLTGRAYHDRNESTVPLDALGIGYWVWGRTPLPDGELIHYLLWPDAGGAAIEARAWFVGLDGRGQELTVHAVDEGSMRRARYGMRHHPEIRIRTSSGPVIVRTASVVDDGPFYLRMFTEVEAPHGTGRGVAEAILPDRIDRAVHRPLVRMAVHDVSGRGSWWAPLFSGPRAGRVSRLFGPRGSA